MAEEASQQPIVVKKIKKVVGGGHGGAWKIAYADFVTAMMAFFLLMWLLGSTSEGTKEGIAEYFKTPLKSALSGATGTGDTTSIIKGGGTDLTRKAGQVKKEPVEQINDPKSIAKAERARKEVAQLKQLKGKIEKSIEANPALRKFKKQLLLDITADGLRIQIVDAQNRPMFASGRADLQPYTRLILHEIGQTLNDVPNKISLSGHTDATPFPSGDSGYSNWELSADRANASRRELIAGSMDSKKILRVVGLSSAVLFDKADPYNPINRRISITVMNKKAENAVTKDSGGERCDLQIWHLTLANQFRLLDTLMVWLTSISRSPACVALLTQIFSFVAILLLLLVLPEQQLSIFQWAILQGVLAALISYQCRMATWWTVIHLLFMPTLAATLALSIPPFWFCIGFLLLVLLYGNTYQTQVPLYLSSQEVTKALISLLPKQRNFSFIDLGCGCGGLLKNLSHVLSNGSYYGIEAAPLPYLVSKLRNILLAPKNTIIWGNFWKDDLAQYDVVYAYLSPVPMKSLWEKARQEMQPGSIFISNSFIIPDVSPEKSIKLNDFSGSTLYLWRI